MKTIAATLSLLALAACATQTVEGPPTAFRLTTPVIEMALRRAGLQGYRRAQARRNHEQRGDSR